MRSKALDPETPTQVSLPLGNYYWVLPGQVLAGEHPRGATPEATRARLAALEAAGIGCFVDLTEPSEAADYREFLDRARYHRHPMPDHSVPSDPADMTAALARIRAARAAGTPVYLHCRAGIGRTGMTAGCLLAESGFPGEAALEELNRLWAASPRSRNWPQVPETDAQHEFVRQWAGSAGAAEPDPLLAPATLAAARLLRGRYLGALLGHAVGDALGVSTQYRRPGRFTPIGDLLGGGPFDLPRGAWSDDTALALCLAESLLERDGFDAQDQAERYRRWQKEGYLSATDQCVGITAGTARALARAQWRRQAFSGSHDPEALDPEVLSRVTPVVLFGFADRERAVEEAAEAARTTCQVPAVLNACRALALALHAAISGASRPEVVASAESLVGSTARPEALGPADSAPAVLAQALQCFAATGSFRDAVLKAANLGGAADVTATVTGALAGAHYTQDAVPTLWRNSLMKLDLLEGFADRLLARALLSFGS
ncbi:MAG: ADP-ribosylglycohydrolase family protein [Proteobacteria bacterium]|nr:ADP-ribosylglycohydrolase family protein [Pseudomonadota bacterium]